MLILILSLKKNIDSLECVLFPEIKCPFYIIAVSDTWLHNDECVYINGYQFVGKGRAEKRGGGVLVGFYIGTGLKFRRCSDLNICNDFIEVFFIEIYCKYSNKILAIFFKIFKITSCNNVNSFIDILNSYSFAPLILKPTRITTQFVTLIDNIFTNRPENNINAGILLTAG